MAKPKTYHERRQWQNAQRAEGLVPECGREACENKAAPAFINKGTPLLDCADCASLINRFTPGACSPEPAPTLATALSGEATTSPSALAPQGSQTPR